MIQTQSRTRPCNVAQCGGSTSICTSTGSTTQSCNNNCCREFYINLMEIVLELDCHVRQQKCLSFLVSILLQSSLSAVDASWASWGPWDSCSKTCGGGVSTSLKDPFQHSPEKSDSMMFMLKLIASYDSDSEQNQNLQRCPMWWKHIHLHKHRVFNTILQQQLLP